MVGDEGACVATWAKLAPLARDLVDQIRGASVMLNHCQCTCLTLPGSHMHLPTGGQVPVLDDQVEGLVWRLRSLRESLISNGMLERTEYRALAIEVSW